MTRNAGTIARAARIVAGLVPLSPIVLLETVLRWIATKPPKTQLDPIARGTV